MIIKNQHLHLCCIFVYVNTTGVGVMCLYCRTVETNVKQFRE